jgi:hypothetical protein
MYSLLGVGLHSSRQLILRCPLFLPLAFPAKAEAPDTRKSQAQKPLDPMNRSMDDAVLSYGF